MDVKNILQEVKDNMQAVLQEDPTLGRPLWQEFIDLHPADIANFFTDNSPEIFQQLFERLPKDA